MIFCLITVCRRIEGSPNFRRVPLTLQLVSSGSSSPSDSAEFIVGDVGDGKMVSGRFVGPLHQVVSSNTICLSCSGMPTVQGCAAS
jgi:hypothetical protein